MYLTTTEYQKIRALKISQPCPARDIPMAIRYIRLIEDRQQQRVLFQWVDASRRSHREVA